MYEDIESKIHSSSNDIDDLKELSNEIVAAKDIADQMKQKAEVCSILISALQMEPNFFCSYLL